MIGFGVGTGRLGRDKGLLMPRRSFPKVVPFLFGQKTLGFQRWCRDREFPVVYAQAGLCI